MKAPTLKGKHRSMVPTAMRPAVKIIDFLRPFSSKYHSTGMRGMMYMMLPQFPSRAMVAGVQVGQKIAKTEAEMGPKLFHTMPWMEIRFSSL